MPTAEEASMVKVENSTECTHKYSEGSMATSPFNSFLLRTWTTEPWTFDQFYRIRQEFSID